MTDEDEIVPATDEEDLADRDQEEAERKAAQRRAGGAPRESDNEASRVVAQAGFRWVQGRRKRSTPSYR